MHQHDARRLDDLRRWARLLDSAFAVPGTPIRFGLDALIGLVPGIGDAVTGFFSIVLVVHASRLGISRLVLLRMIVNVLVDAAIGLVPLVGDLVDIGWKANTRNLQLLERHIASGLRGPTSGDYLFLAAVIVLLMLAIALPLAALYYALQLLGRPLF